MPISPEEASKTLEEIDRTGDYSRELHVYREASPHFLIWGLVWAFGYAVTDYAPEYRNLTWGAGIAVGALGSIILASRQSQGGSRARAGFTWRYAAISAGFAAFFGVMSSVLTLEPRQVDAFVPLVFAGAYLFAGLWAGLRFSLCGVVLAVAVLVGYYNAGPHFSLWMAFAGGGVLMLTSFWLRRV
ncbi:MAG: hypothetical protein ABL973_17085 [Micropepsaceae bacterium]